MRYVTTGLLLGAIGAFVLGCGGGSSGGPSDAPSGDPPSMPLEGFGTISGDCGSLDGPVLDAASPRLFRNALDFGSDPYDAADYDQLGAGGQAIHDAGADGSSLLGDVFGFEVLHRCEEAALLQTREAIEYLDAGGKKADFLVGMKGRQVGVTVERAYGFPPSDPYTLPQAEALLEDALQDVLLANANVAPSGTSAWAKQVLCVLAYSHQHADLLETAYAGMSASLRGNTIVLITVTDGEDAFLY